MRKHMHELVFLLACAAFACWACASSSCGGPGDGLEPGWHPKAGEYRGPNQEQAAAAMGGDIGECFGY